MIDGDSHIYSLGMLWSVGSFGELVYTVYLICFVQFFLEMKVVFVHLALWVDFVVGCTEGSEIFPI